MSMGGRARNIHPGEFLEEEFMKPLGLTAYRLAKDIDVPVNRIDGILKGERSITPDTAVRLGRYFGSSAEMWVNLQAQYDVRKAKESMDETLDRITPLAETEHGKRRYAALSIEQAA